MNEYMFALALLAASSLRSQRSAAGVEPPAGLEFVDLRPADARALSALLDANYITSADGKLQVLYPSSTLRWLLSSPGARQHRRKQHRGRPRPTPTAVSPPP